MSAPAIVIVNPAAGAGKGGTAASDRMTLAQSLFAQHGVEARVVLTARPGHASELAATARRDASPLVVAWGGDGTVNEVAVALAFGGTPLAIVPAGSGNGFARHLGVPFDAARALAGAVLGADRAIDVGELGGRLFVNVAGLGFDAVVAARLNRRRHGRGGLARYALAAIREFLTYQPLRYEARAEGVVHTVDALLIALANGREYGHGAVIAPGAIVDDGLLDLVIAEPRSLARGLWDARRLFRGTIDGASGIAVRRVSQVTITPEADCLAHVDGEPFAASGPLVARVHRAALRVRLDPAWEGRHS